MIIKGSNIDSIYLNLCKQLLKTNPLNSGTREITNCLLELSHVTDDNNILSIRNISKKYLLAELEWYFAGRNDVAFIGAFANTWNNITDDGITNNSAYGYLIKHAHGFDQLEKVIELLTKDPESRRAVINLNIPNERVIETKDEPCTISIQFLIRNNKLCCTVNMRSNDIWFGLPYDVAFFTELQKYIANRLNIKAGSYTHFATSSHLYDRDVEKIKKIVSNPISKPVTFDRKNFHFYCDLISNLIDEAIIENKDIKKTFCDLLKQYKIVEDI